MRRCHEMTNNPLEFRVFRGIGLFVIHDGHMGARLKSESPSINITKPDAARRQLRTAIRLWFDEGDPVSIHTLISAAHEIIHRMYRNSGRKGLLLDSDLVRTELRKEWAEKIKESYNFFKHFDSKKEKKESINFRPELNDILIIFSSHALMQLGETPDTEQLAFAQWMLIHRPHFMDEDVRNRIPIEVLHNLKSVDRKQFLPLFEAAMSGSA